MSAWVTWRVCAPCLSDVVSAGTPPIPIRNLCGKYLEGFRSDPEIRRLHSQLFEW